MQVARTLRIIGRLSGLSACALTLLATSAAVAGLSLDGGGLVLVQEGPAADAAGAPVPLNLATGKTPFSSSDLGPQLGIAYHVVDNLNDGAYGNGFSWIGADENPYPVPFAGIDLGATPVNNVQSIAFGRSNVLSGDPCAGVCTDRHLGLYTLQFTQVANPSGNLDLDITGNPVNGWADIGTLDYGDSDGPGTNYNNTWQRHRYNFSPISATGVRLVVPGTGLGGGTAIDEIELYDVPGEFVPPPPPPAPLVITPAAGFSITWDGNDGDHFDPAAPPDGAVVPDNIARASNGSVPFSSSDLGPQLGIPFHVAENLNDGFYGNSNSWIGGDTNPFAPVRFAGVRFPESVAISSVAWGRDNGNTETDACGGQCMDRSLGLYTLQFTTTANPSADTPDTGDASTGWQSVGTILYRVSDDDFTSYLRHEFDLAIGGAPISATAVRLLVPLTGLGGGTAIDEIEVYTSVLVGDYSANGSLDAGDLDLQAQAIVDGGPVLVYDLNNDGSVTYDDRRVWVIDLKKTYIGDSDLSGEFTSSDLIDVFVAGKYETDEKATWEQGDWNGDTKFGSGDLVAAFVEGGYELGPRAAVRAVPEPSGLALLLGCVPVWLGLARRRRG